LEPFFLEELHFVSIFPFFFSLLFNKNTLCTECLRMKWLISVFFFLKKYLYWKNNLIDIF
jgi:hypothetical protein